MGYSTCIDTGKYRLYYSIIDLSIYGIGLGLQYSPYTHRLTSNSGDYCFFKISSILTQYTSSMADSCKNNFDKTMVRHNTISNISIIRSSLAIDIEFGRPYLTGTSGIVSPSVECYGLRMSAELLQLRFELLLGFNKFDNILNDLCGPPDVSCQRS